MSPLAISLRFLQTQPDRRLVELARAGHERAFEALVQRYRRQLLAYCRHLTLSDATAEDVLQQALMQAWVALRRDDLEVRDVKPWLYRIAHNAAVSQLRRTRHELFDAGHRSESAGGADIEAERRLEARDALAGLAALPEPQRQVMLSTALDGRSHEEVAAALGLTNGSVRGLIYRARAAIRAAAAALIPAPVVSWAARQGVRSGAAPDISQTVAGGGASGIGALLLKGGTLVVGAGVLATTATVAVHQSHAARHVRGSVVQLVGARGSGAAGVQPQSTAHTTGNGSSVAAPSAPPGAPGAANQVAGRDHASPIAGRGGPGGSAGSGGPGRASGHGGSSGPGGGGSASGSPGGPGPGGSGSSGSGGEHSGAGSSGGDGGTSSGSGGSGSTESGSGTSGGGTGGSDGGSLSSELSSGSGGGDGGGSGESHGGTSSTPSGSSSGGSSSDGSSSGGSISGSE